jgi:hypothetical protein
MFGKKDNDERYTPAYGVRPVLEFIPSGSVIWCPFDTKESEFVKVLGQQFEVINSHVWYGQNFYEYQPPVHWDIMISNPPFTNKRLIFERALSFGKPFALLMTMAWLNDNGWIKAYEKYNADVELLAFDKRIKYMRKRQPLENPCTYMTAEGYVESCEGCYKCEGVGEFYTEDKITFASGYYCYKFLPKGVVTRNLMPCGQIEMDFDTGVI